MEHNWSEAASTADTGVVARLAEEGVAEGGFSTSGESSFMVARLGGELESIVLASCHLVQPDNNF